MSSLVACKAYAEGDIAEAIAGFNVAMYRSQLIEKVNDICLEMGFSCRNDKPRYEQLASQLTKNIYSISQNEETRDKLFNYANRITNVGRNYLVLTSGY